jgi:uncharacterized membrane protein YgdD (TMEM256/DUF423 family)
MAALRLFAVFACLSAGLSVGVSAMAAHGATLTAQDAQSLAWAVDLQRFHALGLLVLVPLSRRFDLNHWALGTGALFIAGTLLFSFNIEARLLLGFELARPWVPYGGMAFMAGWLALAIGLGRSTHRD